MPALKAFEISCDIWWSQLSINHKLSVGDTLPGGMFLSHLEPPGAVGAKQSAVMVTLGRTDIRIRMSISIQFRFRLLNYQIKNPGIRNVFILLEATTNFHGLRTKQVVAGGP